MSMANWVTHLRIAEEVLKKIDFSVDIEKYLVGSVAADSGTVGYDENGKRGYNPPRYVSHWIDNVPGWDVSIHYERFYDTYIKNENDFDKKSFYLGYYIHLITDAMWMELVYRPVRESFKTDEEYQKKARNQLKPDWFKAELIFLLNNPGFKPLKILKTINNFDNIYLDYFPSMAIQNKIDEVVKTYADFNVDVNGVFPYLSYEEYEHMTIIITRLIAMSLLSR